jgi:hypothetical protein
MKIYLASRYSRLEEMQLVSQVLGSMGHEVTSRWIMGGHQISDRGLNEGAQETLRQRFAVEDLEDVVAAECVISFTEEPRSSLTRGGRHVEFGLALGLGKRLIVVGPRENVFHCLPQVEVFPDRMAMALSLGAYQCPE